jgi:hypothetical protein
LENLANMIENMVDSINKAEEEYGGERYAEMRQQLAEFAQEFRDVARLLLDQLVGIRKLGLLTLEVRTGGMRGAAAIGSLLCVVLVGHLCSEGPMRTCPERNVPLSDSESRE